MNTISYGRYVPTPKVCKVSGQYKNVFRSVIDHSINIPDNDFELIKAVHSAHTWLKDHFGFVILDLGEGQHIRMCNYKKMVRTFIEQGIVLTLENHIK